MADNFKEFYNSTLGEADFTDNKATVFTTPTDKTYTIRELYSKVSTNLKSNFKVKVGGFEVAELMAKMGGSQVVPEGVSLEIESEEGIYPEQVLTFEADYLWDNSPFLRGKVVQTFIKRGDGSLTPMTNAVHTSHSMSTATSPPNATYSETKISESDDGSITYWAVNNSNNVQTLYYATTGNYSTYSTGYVPWFMCPNHIGYSSSRYLNSLKLSDNTTTMGRHQAGQMNETYDFEHAASSSYPGLWPTNSETPSFLYRGRSADEWELWIPNRSRSSTYQAFNLGQTASAFNSTLQGALTETDSSSQLCFLAKDGTEAFERFYIDNAATGDVSDPVLTQDGNINLSDTLDSFYGTTGFSLNNMFFLDQWPYVMLCVSAGIGWKACLYNVETEEVVADVPIDFTKNDYNSTYMQYSMTQKLTNTATAVGTESATTIDLRVLGIDSDEV